MIKLTYTHRGWFGLCPVYLGELDSEEPELIARHWTLQWLFHLSVAFYALCFLVRELMGNATEPAWPLRVSAKLDTPIHRLVALTPDE